jgi:hypothetical protein
MQDINDEYHEALKHANGHTRKDGEKAYTYRYEYEWEQSIIDKISELLKLKMDDVAIWLIRLWVWIVGDTRLHKEYSKHGNVAGTRNDNAGIGSPTKTAPSTARKAWVSWRNSIARRNSRTKLTLNQSQPEG